MSESDFIRFSVNALASCLALASCRGGWCCKPATKLQRIERLRKHALWLTKFDRGTDITRHQPQSHPLSGWGGDLSFLEPHRRTEGCTPPTKGRRQHDTLL